MKRSRLSAIEAALGPSSSVDETLQQRVASLVRDFQSCLTAPAKAVLADLEKFLTSDELDAQLVKCTVLAEATPHGLAEFAQQLVGLGELGFGL